MWGALIVLMWLGVGLPGWGQGTTAAGGAGSAVAAQAGVSPELLRADAAFKAGYAAVQAGKLEEALRDFKTTVRYAPQLAEGHLALAATLMQLERPGEAVPELEEALALKAGDAGGQSVIAQNLAAAHEGFARQLASKGKLPEAEGEIRAAVAAAAKEVPDGGTGAGTTAQALLEDELGSVLAQELKWPEAEAAFRTAIGMMPAADARSTAGMHLHLGIALVEEKQAAGVDELKLAVAGLPSDSGGKALAEFQLGRALALAGRDEEAVAHFEEAVRLNPNFPQGNLELGMAVQRLGRQADSVPYFEKAIAADPKNVQALTNLGLALAESGHGLDGEVYLRRALVEAPKDPLIYQDLGVAELQESHFDEAIAEFQRALGLDGGNSQLHYDLGLTYKLKDRPEDAIGELKKASELDASLPDPPYTLGILYMQMGRLADAEVALRRALELRPGNGDGWAVLGSVLKQAGKQADAEVALRKAVELSPEQPGARITLAGVLAEEGKKDEAAEQRKVAAGLSRSAVNHQRAMLSTNAGNQAMERGQIGEAVGRYQEAIAADPGFAEAHRRLAEAYERQGRVAEAAAERGKL